MTLCHKTKTEIPYNNHIVILCVFCLTSLEDGRDVDQDGLTVKKSRMGKYLASFSPTYTSCMDMISDHLYLVSLL